MLVVMSPNKQILCDSTYMRYLEVVKFMETEIKMVDVMGNGIGEITVLYCILQEKQF